MTFENENGPKKSNNNLYGFPPSLYLIGAQKCATTYFAECIAGHPEIDIAIPKEPHFFSKRFREDLQSYRRFFNSPKNRILLDASPSYSLAPFAEEERTESNPRNGVPARIKQAAPNAKIIYVVRDPVDRTHSSYWHAVRVGDESLDFETAMRKRSRYLDGSRYYFQIQQYMNYFPTDDILLLEMGEVTKSLETALQKVWDHLGVEVPNEVVTPDAPRNRSYRFNAFGRWLAQSHRNRNVMKAAAKSARSVLPGRAYSGMRRLLSKDIPPMTPTQRDLVRRELESDARRFTEMSGIRFESFAGER